MSTTYYATASGDLQIDMSPGATLDYEFEWDRPDRDGNVWLATGETISTRLVSVGAGITKDSDSIAADGKSVVVWLSGGSIGAKPRITCKITTSAGRTDSRSFILNVVQR